MTSAVDSSICVSREAGALGAIVTGVDLAQRVDDATFDAIHDAFVENLVICIRGQAHIRPEDQLEFAARWGEISVHPYVPSIDGYEGVMRVSDPTPVTTTWHADTTHLAAPPALTLLLARQIPAYGGDTMFANQYLAYERLSPGLRATLDGLRAVHKGTELAKEAGLDREAVTAVHPVVRTHPVSGKRSLFVNGNYTSHFDGWTVEESAPLLAQLYAEACRPEYTWRHRWQPGDVVIWDNRCTQHAVVADVSAGERVLHRVTIAGDIPV